MQQDNSLVHLSITDETALAAAYMPFIDGGGLFIKTDSAIAMGAELHVSLRLFEDPHEIPVVGKVVWINPGHVAENGKGNNKWQGVGVRLPESLKQLKLRIENLLPDCQEPSADTPTL